jgi:predicted phage terminase large subunit-like protein
LARWIASPNGLQGLATEKARRHLIDFCIFTFAQYHPARVHRYMADRLEAVERGDIDRLMLFCPPRTGKTELLVRFAAWHLGRHPDQPILYASYGADLAWEKSGDTRAVVASEEFSEVFPQVRLNPANRSVQRWRIAGHRGGMQAQGVGGPLTGKGGFLILVDDPVKNRQDADSHGMREATWKWYTSTLRTRLEPGGRIILVMTRWHEDDLAGRLLAKAGEDPKADQWTVVSLPALARDTETGGHGDTERDPLGRQAGEALDPERYNRQELLRTKASIGERDWTALYDQTPRADDGNVFKLVWLSYVTQVPAMAYECVVWDTAFEEKQASDYSAAVWVARGENGHLYVRPCVNERLAFPDLVKVAREQVGRYQRAEHLVEGKASGKSLRQQLRADGIPLIEIPAQGDKTARAHAVTRYFEAGLVHIVGDADASPLVDALESELLAFPRGAHDDLVDAMVYGIMRSVGLIEEEVEETVVVDERVAISPV